MSSTKATGHRTRLRSRFLENDQATLTDEALLELLLTYAIPRKDVQPLAWQLLSKFGDINSIIQNLPVPEKERPNNATIADWIRHCKRSGLYEQGKLLYENGGLNLENLTETDQV